MQLAELVRRGQQGDDEAFTALMRHSQRMAFGYACAILRDSALAEDAVQTTMLEAWRHIGIIRDTDRFDAWVRGIVRYT